MLKRIISTAVLAVAMLSCVGQRSDERVVSHFTRVEVKGALKVMYRQGDSTVVRVVADAADLDNIITQVDGGTLRISGKGENEDAVVYVTSKELDGIDVQGAATFTGENEIKGPAIAITVSGASTARLQLNVPKIKCVQTGASNLTLSGNCDQFSANISGASTLKAFDLVARVSEVESSGASTAKVTATESFAGNATGASNIRLQGEPKDVTAETSSAASISRIKGKTEKAGSDTVTYNWNNKKLIIVDNESDEKRSEKKTAKTGNTSKFKHWRGVMLGVNGYMHPSGGLEMPRSLAYMDLNYARSFNIQINPIERQFYIVRHYVKIVTGMGLDLHRFEFANKTTLDADSAFTGGVIDSTGLASYQKNKFRATYLQVPLLLEFNTSSNYRRTFHVAMGVIGQYRIGASTRQLINSGGYEIERLNRDDYNLNPFGLKAHLNFGYRGWTIFGEYNLTTLFKTGKGPELYPITAGLRVIPFS